MYRFLFWMLLCGIVACADDSSNPSQEEVPALPKVDKALQDSIIKEHLEQGAWKKGMYSRAWQEEIDKGLAKDSTIAYLWQQKAMPLFKQGKYEVGMDYIDQAVKYDPQRWQEYRAFIKCIFANTYRAAIEDFESCKARYGNNIVMDHSYDFYIGLSYLQLNEFEKAESVLAKDIDSQIALRGKDWVHYLDWFYLGIARYEQGKFGEALEAFDMSLADYSTFSEAMYYKGYCIGKQGTEDEARELINKAMDLGKQGYTINEDNAIYERYPYQIRWKRD